MLAGLIVGWAIGFIMALWLDILMGKYDEDAREDTELDPYSRRAAPYYKTKNKKAKEDNKD